MNPRHVPATSAPCGGGSVAIVVIGRNEGARLARCLESIAACYPTGSSGRLSGAEEGCGLIYVDSSSTDGSPETAFGLGADVLTLKSENPTAAQGRNIGWRHARSEFVLFLDGDTVLYPEFLPDALRALRVDDTVAAVWGHRRELHPESSIFNRVLDLDWIFRSGESRFCGGDVLMRRSVLVETGGYDGGLIAGEEPELCRRIRARGYRIMHTDCRMTGHDMEMTTCRQYWKRATRAGYAYAEVGDRYRDTRDPMWLAESRGNVWRGGVWLGSLLVALFALVWSAFPLLVWIASAIVVCLRSAYKARWKVPGPRSLLLAYGFHSQFQHIPMLVGQIKWFLDRISGRRHRLIEYKEPAAR